MQTMTQIDGKAVNTKSTFSTQCAVAIHIKASPEIVWGLLTDVSKILEWNSTIISLTGKIAVNETIHLKSTSAPERTFKLKVAKMDAPREMIWQDGMAPMFKGVRTYTFSPKSDGTTDFYMVEVIQGVMLPLIGGALPDFRPTFEQFAADLKQAAENA